MVFHTLLLDFKFYDEVPLTCYYLQNGHHRVAALREYLRQIEAKEIDVPDKNLDPLWPAHILVEEDLSCDEMEAVCRNLPEVQGRPDSNWDLIKLSLQREGDIPMESFNIFFPKSEKPNANYIRSFNK